VVCTVPMPVLLLPLLVLTMPVPMILTPMRMTMSDVAKKRHPNYI
jgi:hypothetical protein